jgi:hypothetical protein
MSAAQKLKAKLFAGESQQQQQGSESAPSLSLKIDIPNSRSSTPLPGARPQLVKRSEHNASANGFTSGSGPVPAVPVFPGQKTDDGEFDEHPGSNHTTPGTNTPNQEPQQQQRESYRQRLLNKLGTRYASVEEYRLDQDRDRVRHWKRWGPYLSERQWATVREDYSANGDAWTHFPHDHARSRAYRWGEDGIGGISDNHGRLCWSLALWNEEDDILKERLFGVTGHQGNHGEDVKELYYYLDSTVSV